MSQDIALSVSIEPYNDAQRYFLLYQGKVGAFIGGVGSGKTHIGAAKFVMKRLEFPSATMLVAANTYGQLESATLPGLFRILTEWSIPYKYNKHTKTITIEMEGYEKGIIYCRSLENYDFLRGMELFYIWMDETRDTNREAFDVCLTRLREKVFVRDMRLTFVDTEGKTRREEYHQGDKVPSYIPADAIGKNILAETQMLITTTPDMIKAKWLYDYLHNPVLKQELMDSGIEIAAFHCSSRENPYLDPTYIELMAQSFDDEFAKQEIEGQWVIIPPGKPVYAGSFDIDLHTGDFQYIESKPLYVFWDFGFHHPAALFCQEDDCDRLVILGELLGTDIDLESFCDDVWNYIIKNLGAKNTSIKVHSYCDPAGKQKSDKRKDQKTSIGILRSKGFKVVQHKKLNIPPGILCVRRLLNKLINKRPALLFDRHNCPITLQGLRGGYHYAEKKKELQEVKEEPYKDGYYEHLMDALRYGVTNMRYIYAERPKRKDKYKAAWSVIDKTSGY